MRDMLCPRLPKSGVNPYTPTRTHPYTHRVPSHQPRCFVGPWEDPTRRRAQGGLIYACYHALAFLPSYVPSMYVAKGGRRRPGPISRFATPPGSQVGPCRPALMSALWGENWSRPQPRRAGPRPEVDGAVPLVKLHRPPRGGVKCGTFGANAVVWCHSWLPPRSPCCLPTSHPPTRPPTHRLRSPTAHGHAHGGTVQVGWGGGVGAHPPSVGTYLCSDLWASAPCDGAQCRTWVPSA